MADGASDMPSADALIARGAEALRAGERGAARELLAAAVRADPHSARAWLWLSGAVDDPARQRECLERALAIDPENVAALRGLGAVAGGVAGGRREAGGGRREAGGGAAAPASERSERPVSRLPPPASEPSERLVVRRLPSPTVTAILGGLGGLGAALAWAAWRNLGDEASLAQLLIVVLLVGPPLGLGGMVVGGVLLRTSGRLLGGRGGAAAVRAGLAWAAAPQALGLLIWAGQLLFIPAASFSGAAAPAGQLAAAAACGAAHAMLGLASAALAVAGVAEAHRIALWRAAAAWLLASLIVLGGLAAVFAGSALLIALRGG